MSLGYSSNSQFFLASLSVLVPLLLKSPVQLLVFVLLLALVGGLVPVTTQLSQLRSESLQFGIVGNHKRHQISLVQFTIVACKMN